MGNRENTDGFEQFEVWQKAIDLAVSIYKLTDNFPKSEIYSLTNQMRRASSSISANIAEGYGRHGYKEKMQFYKIANGSLLETKSFCYLANRLGYINDQELDETIPHFVDLQRLINALIRSIRMKNDDE
ncbi:MAG: four helix bundle protein [Candidatus Saccharimonadaceae bacterium]